MGEFLALH